MADPGVTKPSGRGRVDWAGEDGQRALARYAAGENVRAIAADLGVSHVALLKAAKARNIEPDLEARIQSKAAAKVQRQAALLHSPSINPEIQAQVVEAAADAQAIVELREREDVRRLRALCQSLADELEAASQHREALEHLGNEMVLAIEGEGKGAQQQRERMMKVLDAALTLPGRATTMQKLVNSFATLLGAERTVFGIRSPEPGKGGLSDLSDEDLLGEIRKVSAKLGDNVLPFLRRA